MKYPKEYIDEIKLRLKVSQVVGKSVQLKKRGKEFIGLSPFKNEKSPSFTINDEKEFYHCFSTGEHGNIFDFLMKTKSMGFGEAVKALAAEAGMQPYRFSNFDEKKEKKFQIYKSIYKEYNNFFHEKIFTSDSYEAANYLKKRGLNKNIVEEFKLGYVPWKNNFYETLLKKYSHQEVESTGLYYKNDKTQKYVDRFNSRIIFPISNLAGDVIAFGGRIIKDGKLAKYINSPETDFYKKGRMVFNLNNAKNFRSETKEVIIVEGYMDVVSLHCAGIKNVISNSGTALTEGQIELIWKFFSNPVICLDGDVSGQNAALRIAERLFSMISENNKIFFSILPQGEDPDDYIKKNGKESFAKLLQEKKIIQQYIWDEYASKVEKNNPFAISKFEKEIKKMCFSIKDETLRKYILEDFLEKIKSLTPLQSTKKDFKYYKQKDFKILNVTKQIFKKKNKFSKAELKENSILYIMLNYCESIKEKLEEVEETNFLNSENNDLKNEILKQIKNNTEQDKLKDQIDKKYGPIIENLEQDINLKNILLKKSNIEKQEILIDFLQELRELNQLKEIESLEGKVAKNLDENLYSELIRLKSQLNRD